MSAIKDHIDLIEYTLTACSKNNERFYACAIAQIYDISYTLTSEEKKILEEELYNEMSSELNDNAVFLDKEFCKLYTTDNTHKWKIDESKIQDLSAGNDSKDLVLYANKYGVDVFDYIHNPEDLRNQKFRFNYRIDKESGAAEFYEYDDANGWLLCGTSDDIDFTIKGEYHLPEEMLLDEFKQFIKKSEEYIGALFNYNVSLQEIGNYDINSDDAFHKEQLSDGYAIEFRHATDDAYQCETFNTIAQGSPSANDIIVMLTKNGELQKDSLSFDIQQKKITLTENWVCNGSTLKDREGVQEYTVGAEIDLLVAFHDDNDSLYRIGINVDAENKTFAFSKIQESTPPAVNETNIPVVMHYDDNKTYTFYLDAINSNSKLLSIK